MPDPTDYAWADAIARRISDEWNVDDATDVQDRHLLYEVLKTCLANQPDQMRRLIGTTIIEETYFEPAWIDSHSVNCALCGQLYDERTSIAFLIEGGEICPNHTITPDLLPLLIN